MTIRPVTSATLVGNLNQFNFEGKKKKNLNVSQPINYTPLKLAVPLAAAMTMAPLNVLDSKNVYNHNLDIEKNRIEYIDNTNIINDDGVVIGSKNFISKKYGPYRVDLVSTDGNNETFEKVVMVSKNELIGKLTKNEVKNLVTYNYQVISNDGSKGSNFELKDVFVDSGLDMNVTPFVYNQKDIVDYIEKLVDSPKNNGAITRLNYNRTIRPSDNANLQNVGGGDIMKNAPAYKYASGKLVTTSNVEDDGKITGKLRFYSCDGNDDNVEYVTYQKNGYPELKLIYLYESTHTFEPYSEEPKSLKMYIMGLVDGNHKKYYVEDPGLVLGIANLMQENPGFMDNALFPFSKDIKYLLTPKGAISPIAGD